MTIISRFTFIVFALLASAMYAQNAPEQTVAEEKTRTELLNELNLRTAQVDLEHAKEAYERYKREYENARRLFEESIMSKKELDEALSIYTLAEQQLKQAEIQLERTKLSFLDKASHITVMEAKKYYDSDGKRMLDLVLKNTSNMAQAESALGMTENLIKSNSYWQNPEQIKALLNIENIIVSVVDNSSSIGKPYEKILPVLPYAEEEKLTFLLLTDAQQVGIKMQYLDQDVTENIFLEKESLQERPTIIASQFSQEGQLGAEIHYDLSLEMLVTSDRNFSLAVTNIPPQINYSFIDSESSARITSLRFTEDVSKHDLDLIISVPQKLDVDMIDKAINFQAWIVTSKQLELVDQLKRKYPNGNIPVEELEIKKINPNKVDLALIPKGSGRLEILINNLYTEIKPGHDINIKADLDNNGTLDLFNITPEVSPPLNWNVQIEPRNVAKLAVGDRKSIQITMKPASDVIAGEYEAQIEAKGQSGSQTIEALEKRLKIRVSDDTHVITTLILVLALVSIIGIITVFSIKLSRR